MNMEKNSSKRGLASADKQTRERVAQLGGKAPHNKRGLQAADQKTRVMVAQMGGRSHGRGW
jgi:hypothetical protein